MVHRLALLIATFVLLIGAAPATDGAPAARLAVPQGWSMAGRIQTVRGPIAPNDAGMVLPHEHLFTNFFEPAERLGYNLDGPIPLPAARFMQSFGLLFVPDTPDKQRFWDRPDIDLGMIAKMREGAVWGSLAAYQNKNMALLDRDADAIDEAQKFRSVGGGTIVDVTVEGIGRSPARLRRVSDVTGVNIVMGTGWYRWPFHPPSIAKLTVDQLAQIMIDDIVTGDRSMGIRAGIIGEIPIDPSSVVVDGPLLSAEALAERRAAQMRRANAPGALLADVIHPDELRVLRAAARAAKVTGAALTLHYLTSSLRPLDVIEEEGLDLHRVIVGHADTSILNPGVAEAMLARGVTLEMDYGLQYTAVTGPMFPIQAAVLDAITRLIKNGHADQIILSHDMCSRLNLSRYGGSGLTWISKYVIPYLRRKGVTENQIRQMTVTNPQRLLTFVQPARVR